MLIVKTQRAFITISSAEIVETIAPKRSERENIINQKNFALTRAANRNKGRNH